MAAPPTMPKEASATGGKPAGRAGGEDEVRSQAGRREEPPRDAHSVDAQPADHVEDEDETAEG